MFHPLSSSRPTCTVVWSFFSSYNLATWVERERGEFRYGLYFIYDRPTFVKIYKKMAVEEFKPDPYIATAMNCMLWIFYGLPMVHPDSILVVTINSIGLAMELIYLSIFFLYAPNKGRVSTSLSHPFSNLFFHTSFLHMFMNWILYIKLKLQAKVIGWVALEILFLGVVAACTLTLRKTHAQRSDLVGILCVIFGVLMYASPLTVMVCHFSFYLFPSFSYIICL